MKNILLIVALVAVSFAACTRKESGGGTDSLSTDKPIKKGDLKAELDMYRDSAEFYWTKIEGMHDLKNKNLDRLLLEISYTDKPNTIEMERCKALVKELPSYKLDKFTMTSAMIDKFYAAEDTAIARCTRLAVATPGIENHSIVETLLSEIQDANGDKFSSALGQYDFYAKSYNDLIEKNPKKVEKLGEPHVSAKKYQYFTIGLK